MAAAAHSWRQGTALAFVLIVALWLGGCAAGPTVGKGGSLPWAVGMSERSLRERVAADPFPTAAQVGLASSALTDSKQ